MFLEHFGLREDPFGMTPDPGYLYASRTHAEALASLSEGIRDTRGFLALVAEPGMGKTTLLYQLAQELRDTTRIVHVSQTQCNSREFIEYILQELGLEVNGISFVAMHGKLNEILFEELLAGKRFLLIVDEAQNLDDSVLETVRMLSNFETHNAKLLQILLAGQPQLAAKLSQPRLAQLRQRVAVLGRLDPLPFDETRRYISHRLKVAGYSGEPIFDDDAIGLICRQSRGIPRNINNLCYNSLRIAHVRGQHSVPADIVQDAATCLDMDPLAHPMSRLSAMVTGAHPATSVVRTGSPETSSPPASPAEKNVSAHSLLTYDAPEKSGAPNWRARSAILGAVLLCGTMLLAILVRSQSNRSYPAGASNPAANSAAPGAGIGSAASDPARADYDAVPQDTGDGQVLTVAAGPQDTIKDLSIRYRGRFDGELAEKIKRLNPDLKDADHLQEGQLVRIPLPPGALRKVNDTEEAPAPPPAPRPQGFLGKFTALLSPRK
jgi:type II secretory pathway predicted ATPase ExeA